MRMQLLIALAASAVLAISSLACCAVGWGGARGSGRVVEKEFEVEDFSGVELATFGNLIIEVGDEEKLRIEAEDNLIRYFEANVLDHMLKIESQPGVHMRPTRPVNLYLTVKELDTLVVSGSGDVEAPDLTAGQFFVKITGSGDVEMNSLNADEVKVRITGSGNLDISETEARKQEITITGSGDVEIRDLGADVVTVQITGSGNVDVLDGQVGEQVIALSGSGDYGARRLESDEADVRIDGSGGATIQVRERLEARITGSGDVHYVGSPRINQTVSGSGDLVRIGE